MEKITNESLGATHTGSLKENKKKNICFFYYKKPQRRNLNNYNITKILQEYDIFIKNTKL